MVGRFTTADSVLGADPLGDNYVYVGGMVESATDPSGHNCLSAVLEDQSGCGEGGGPGVGGGGEGGEGPDARKPVGPNDAPEPEPKPENPAEVERRAAEARATNLEVKAHLEEQEGKFGEEYSRRADINEENKIHPPKPDNGKVSDTNGDSNGTSAPTENNTGRSWQSDTNEPLSHEYIAGSSLFYG